MARKGSANKQPGNPSIPDQHEDCWQFVNVSNRKETHNVQTRRLVRANAARVYWRGRRKHGLQSHTEGTASSEGDQNGRAQTSFVRLVHRNSTEAWHNHQMPVLPANMQTLSVELETPSLTSESVRNLTYHERAVHTDSRQGEDAGTELQLSSAAMQAGTVASPVTFASGAIDPFNSLPIGGSPRYTSYILNQCKSPHTQIEFPSAKILPVCR